MYSILYFNYEKVLVVTRCGELSRSFVELPMDAEAELLAAAVLEAWDNFDDCDCDDADRIWDSLKPIGDAFSVQRETMHTIKKVLAANMRETLWNPARIRLFPTRQTTSYRVETDAVELLPGSVGRALGAGIRQAMEATI